MGTFSIWHWTIVLALFLGLYIVPIAAADTNKHLARKPYALRTIGFFLAIVAINVTASAVEKGFAAGVISGAVLAVFMVLWSVHRAQDIGWSKWSCLLFLIPFVALIFWLVFLFKPGRRRLQTVELPQQEVERLPSAHTPITNGCPKTDTSHEPMSQVKAMPRSGYIQTHWRGEFSLVRSYWIHGVLLSVQLNVSILVLDEPLSRSGLNTHTILIIGLLSIALLAVITIWQVVGTWRSASNTSMRTGRHFWPGVAKVFISFGLLGAIYNTGTGVRDLISILDRLRDPLIADYMIERRGDTDVILTGAINEKSAREIIVALEDPSITISRVSSQGGLIEPAVQLARYIQKNDVMVMAETQCVSACVMLLAASPYSAIYPGTVVTFHRAESLVEFTNPEIRRESALYLAEAEEIYREFGVADWAIETASRQKYWTPTIDQLIGMNLIVYIYDPKQQRFMPADEYCSAYPSECP